MTKLDYIKSYEEGTDLYKTINKPKSFKDELHPNKSYHQVVYEALKLEYDVYNYFCHNHYKVKWNDVLYTDTEFHEDVYNKPDMYIYEDGVVNGVEVKNISEPNTKNLNMAIGKSKEENAQFLAYPDGNLIKLMNLNTMELVDVFTNIEASLKDYADMELSTRFKLSKLYKDVLAKVNRKTTYEERCIINARVVEALLDYLYDEARDDYYNNHSYSPNSERLNKWEIIRYAYNDATEYTSRVATVSDKSYDFYLEVDYIIKEMDIKKYLNY